MTTTNPPVTDVSNEITTFLVEAGVISEEQVTYARRIREKLGNARPLAMVLQELELVSEEQLLEVLQGKLQDVDLGTLLLEFGFLEEPELQTARGIEKDLDGSKPLGEILVENHFLSEDELLGVLSVQLGLHYLALDALPRDKQLLDRVTPRWLQRRSCFPVRDDEGGLLLATTDPGDEECLAEAQRFFGEPVTPCLARRQVIENAIAAIAQVGKRTESTSESEIVRLVDEMLRDAVKNGASDIHVEPMKDRLRVRFRQDGVLVQHQDLPLDTVRPLVSRLKILAGADIAERRRHQDGRLFYEYEGAKLDLRVSFYSTIHGEKTVLRLLNNRDTLLDVGELGMAPRMTERFGQDVLDVPSGVVLVTGPTGSGKTTTLYAAVNHLNNINTSIITAEDPVEYVINGISQCSINAKIGTTYEETLRHIVRQDPDVIVIGEIRDRFSADTAIQAALTGHKVLTTFHTEDAIGGLLRLLHMDIEAFLISSTVVSVLAQRLVRRVCPRCSEEHVLTADEIRRLGYNPKDVSRLVFARGKGCEHCRYLGYKGRVAVFELLILNEPVKDALLRRATSYEIRNISIESTGLVSLLEDGIVKAASGQTTFAEIIRTLPRLAPPRPLNELYRLQGVKR